MDIPLIKRQLITYTVPGLAYFVIAKLSTLLLAIEPSEATAVWPAAGVSVSAIIFLGFRAWFGLLTGILAFYGHLWLDVSSLKTLASSVTLILLLSSATILHALAAVFLCHRLLGNNIDLIDDGKIVIFLFIIGPFVSSLTSLISVGTFRLFDIIDPSEFFIGWLTWWTGDSIGAMLTTPILLTFFSTQTNALYSRRISAGLPMAAILLAIFALFLVAKDFREQEQRQRFVGQVEQLHSHIKNRFDASIEVLFSIRSFFNSSNLISRNDFSNFSRRKLERYPEIKALEWIPHIHDQFRDQFEALTEGPGHISQLDSSGNLIIASQRNHYYPVMYLEPLEGNQRAFGFDVSSNLKAAEFQQQALLSNEIVLTAPIRLIQEHGNQLGVAAYLAVAHQRVDSGMSDEGFIAGIYRFGDFLASVLAQREDLSRAINLKVLDITQSSVVMYQDKTAQRQHNNPLHWHTDHAAGGRIYRFEYSATNDFFSNIYQWYSWGVLLAGVLFSGLLSCWLLSLTGRNLRITQLVNERTASLTHEIEERKRTEKEMVKLSKAVEFSPYIVLITTLDGEIEYASPKLTEVTGYCEAEVIGQNINMLHFEHSDETSYATIWQDLTDNPDWSGEIINKKKPESFYWAQVQIAPIYDRQVKPTHFVVALKDVTEARTISQQISYQARHDKLTGLLNRHEFEAQLNQLLRSDFQPGASHAFCFLDLDRFKMVNDNAGHIAGDELLRQIACLFQERVRTSDTLARLGGDEFGILMQGCPLDRAVTIANNIRNAIAQLEFTWQQQRFSIGVSIGVIRIDNNVTNVTEVLQQADAACYAAKHSGRNRVHLLQPEKAVNPKNKEA